MEGYVCPSDRQLALRARLGTGWSTVAQADQRRLNTRLSNEELDHIYRVLQRNEFINERENQRVELMLKRLDNMTVTAGPQTKTACGICGHEFGLLHKSSTRCADCGRLVCSRCSMAYTEELPKKQRLTGNAANISPSRYLPPGSLGVEENRTTGLKERHRLWRSRQLSEHQDDSNKGLRSQDRSTNGGAVDGRLKYNSFSLQRHQSLSRLSSLFMLPLSLTSNVALTPSSNWIHLCKACCEAREVWKMSGAWFDRSLPKISSHSNCFSSSLCPRPSASLVDGWTSVHARSHTEQLTSSTSDDDWTRIEKRPHEPVEPGVGGRSRSSQIIPGSTPEDAKSAPKLPIEDASCSSSMTITNSAIGVAGGLFESPSCKSPKEQLSHPQQTQTTPPPLSKVEPKVNSQMSESMSKSSFRSVERSSQIRRGSKVQSLFPEARVNLGPNSPKTALFTFIPFPELNFKHSPTNRKSANSLAEAPLGILYFSVTHDAANCKLHVYIHKAKNLVAMDANGLSDPFVVCQLLPTNGIRHRTRTLPQTLNPVWNEVFTFNDIDNRKLEKKTLRFSVLDEDIFGADWLGEYRLGLGELLLDRLSEFAVPLNPHKPLPKEVDDIANPTRGKIQIALRYIEETKQLCVEVIRCAYLIPMDSNGYSDPFVKLYLRPDKLRKTKQKTKVKKSTLFPEFKEQFFFSMDASEVNKRTLEITVWDFDRAATNDFIGGLTLGAKAKAERREVWQAIFRPSYRRFEAWFQLASRSDVGYSSGDDVTDHPSTSGICD